MYYLHIGAYYDDKRIRYQSFAHTRRKRAFRIRVEPALKQGRKLRP